MFLFHCALILPNIQQNLTTYLYASATNMLYLFSKPIRDESAKDILRDALVVHTENERLAYALVASFIFWALMAWPVLANWGRSSTEQATIKADMEQVQITTMQRTKLAGDRI